MDAVQATSVALHKDEAGRQAPVLSRGLTLELVRVAERAAIAAAAWRGKGDEMAADAAAVEAMRAELARVEIDGRIVIGEGERDEAPMLYVGESVGTGQGAAKHWNPKSVSKKLHNEE